VNTSDEQLAALRRIVRELDKLDPPARARALRWLYDRYVFALDQEGTEPT